jgi:hypothetical protein
MNGKRKNFIDKSGKKRTSNGYVEFFLCTNVLIPECDRVLIISRTKVQGVPPSYEVVFATEDIKEAEQEIARLCDIYG